MFGRIANLFKGFLSLFISGVEKRNPEALLELEQENLRKQIGNFNQGLASHAGLCERLMSQVRKLEAAGVLPPADRSPSGYRDYAEGHVAAAAAYRALTAAVGPLEARSMMQDAGRDRAAMLLPLASLDMSNIPERIPQAVPA